LINPYGSLLPRITVEISRSKIIIKNAGEIDIYDIYWSVNITGGFFNLIHKFFQGSVDVLLPGDDIVKEIPIFIGFGPFEINVNGGGSNLKPFSTTAQGFIIFFFIILK
jgi:hypothetical protein